jgi:tRNA threonylcarbamoyladenosine modification (KEOPS) complex  Pcc1 subunit
MAARAELELALDSLAQADALEAALRPEMGSDVPGSRATLERQGSTLLLRLEAEDAGALRAALNAYLRWASLALDVHGVARGHL